MSHHLLSGVVSREFPLESDLSLSLAVSSLSLSRLRSLSFSLFRSALKGVSLTLSLFHFFTRSLFHSAVSGTHAVHSTSTDTTTTARRRSRQCVFSKELAEGRFFHSSLVGRRSWWPLAFRFSFLSLQGGGVRVL